MARAGFELIHVWDGNYAFWTIKSAFSTQILNGITPWNPETEYMFMTAGIGSFGGI